MSTATIKPGDTVFDTIAKTDRTVRRLIGTGSRPVGVVLIVPGKPDQARALYEVRLAAPTEPDLLQPAKQPAA